jgi:hypothetical protein
MSGGSGIVIIRYQIWYLILFLGKAFIYLHININYHIFYEFWTKPRWNKFNINCTF